LFVRVTSLHFRKQVLVSKIFGIGYVRLHLELVQWRSEEMKHLEPNITVAGIEGLYDSISQTLVKDLREELPALNNGVIVPLILLLILLEKKFLNSVPSECRRSVAEQMISPDSLLLLISAVFKIDIPVAVLNEAVSIADTFPLEYGKGVE
jgi:hypothetical protein